MAPLSETIAVQGKLEPGSRVKEVDAPVPGLVVEVLVKEGQRVQQGEPLLRFDLTDARSKLAAAEAVRTRLSNENAVLRASLGEIEPGVLTPNQRQQLINQKLALSSSSRAATEALKKSRATLAGLQISLATAENISRRYRDLARTGAVSEVQALDAQNKVDELQARISAEEREVDRLDATLVNTDSGSQVDLRNRIEENLRQISELDKQISDARLLLRYNQIKAPSNGIVFDISVGRQSVVTQQPEKPLMKIVPQDNLQARVYLPNRAIGFIHIGQKADLSIDTFDASDYGRIPATVQRIGSDALTPEELTRALGSDSKGLYFPTILKLQQQSLKVGQRSIPLQAGMSLTADITIRQRRFINILTSLFEDKRRGLERLR
ncbi:MAG: HlyD family efflux transporter periplasmic adaptor subunit [Cyanobium sp.]